MHHSATGSDVLEENLRNESFLDYSRLPTKYGAPSTVLAAASVVLVANFVAKCRKHSQDIVIQRVNELMGCPFGCQKAGLQQQFQVPLQGSSVG